MDVLQVIHTNNGESRVSLIKSPPCSQRKQKQISTSIVIDDEDSSSSSSFSDNSDEVDDEKVEQKRNQFGNHVASFCFKPNSRTPLALLSAGNKKSPSTAMVKGKVQQARSAPPVSLNLREVPTNESELLIPDTGCSSSSAAAARTEAKELPQFSNSLGPILRSFSNCPICLQPFPVLATMEEEMKKKKSKRKSSKIVRKAITGAARLTHLQICSLRREIPRDVVLSLIGRERIRLDRNQREEYNEEINNQRLWKTLTGDAPPSTQAQQSAIKGRKRWKGKSVVVAAAAAAAVEAKAQAKKTKAAPTPPSFKAGKRGGLNRATTLILAPRLTRTLAKERCIDLFGLPDKETIEHRIDTEADLFGHHEERTLRCQRAAAAASQYQMVIGLGVGACSRNVEQDTKGSIARLGMGFSMGSAIAQRFRSSD